VESPGAVDPGEEKEKKKRGFGPGGEGGRFIGTGDWDHVRGSRQGGQRGEKITTGEENVEKRCWASENPLSNDCAAPTGKKKKGFKTKIIEQGGKGQGGINIHSAKTGERSEGMITK